MFYDLWDVFDNFIHDKMMKIFVLIFGLNQLNFVCLKKGPSATFYEEKTSKFE